MARRPQEDRLETIYEAVETHPGECPGFFARLLGLNRSAITRSLPAMEEDGYLLSEDDEGGLWPFKRKR